MLFNYPADTKEDVEAIRDSVKEVLKNGGLEVTQWSTGGASVQKTRGISMQRLMDETLAYLQLNFPEEYGKRHKRISPYYTGF